MRLKKDRTIKYLDGDVELPFENFYLGRCCFFFINKKKKIFELRYTKVNSYNDYKFMIKKFKNLRELMRCATDMYLINTSVYRDLLRVYFDM